MKIEINNNRKIMGVQKEFSRTFPDMRIEFYEKPSKPGGHPSKKLVKSSSKTLAACRAVTNKGVIAILPGMTVGEVKANFRDVFGLSAEIFEKVKSAGNKIVKENKVLEAK